MSNAPLPILLYHRIDHEGLSTSTPPEDFRRHLETMKERGWRALAADEFARVLEGKGSVPPRSFLITFDDGYETVASVALDVLRDLGFPAICFIATQFMRGAMSGEEPPAEAEPEKFMTWQQVRTLQDSGLVDCQSHSHTHRNFTGEPLTVLCEDLVQSLALLSHELRLPAHHFSHLAWPWGLSAPEWRDTARSLGFRYQYGVSRQSFRIGMPADDIPRTCFDAVSMPAFQRQLWLQAGAPAPLWDIAYPFGKRLRGFSRVLKRAA
jgi:peptidoglycan/xylan/chitin deacetylase (PgdA/CDA1 family)